MEQDPIVVVIIAVVRPLAWIEISLMAAKASRMKDKGQTV
jgi:hypothetical protein